MLPDLLTTVSSDGLLLSVLSSNEGGCALAMARLPLEAERLNTVGQTVRTATRTQTAEGSSTLPRSDPGSRPAGRLSVLDIPHRQSSHNPSHQDSTQLQDILNPVRGVRDALLRWGASLRCQTGPRAKLLDLSDSRERVSMPWMVVVLP